MSDEPVLQGLHLCRAFGSGAERTVALDSTSIYLFPGQFTLLMGPSGSGKSTLLAILSALLPPDSGHVIVGGHDIWSLTEVQREKLRGREFGFVFQGYNLFPALSARQQLEIVLRWGNQLGGREARKRSEAILDRLGLGKKLHLRPNQMSGGEKQRVAIARALVKQPRVCFADEPTSNLDWHHGENVVRLLKEMVLEMNLSLLVVTHDHRLEPFADRILHLEDGHLLERDLGLKHD
ncbi:MAG TPA: ABC transporter ATP-binding protein [Gemmatales bacterium]|nr:ABC transporter ATP-binding protein [Gemmatales bacterium]